MTLKRLQATFSPRRVNNLDETVDLGNLGLGAARSLQAYEHFSGLNFTGRTVASYARQFPFVYTPDAELERKEISISPTTHLIFLDEEAVVFSEQGGVLSSLNTAATYIWCALQEGLDQAGIIQGLARLCEMDQASAKVHYHALLSHLDGLDLLSQPASEHMAEADTPQKPDEQRQILKVERVWCSERFYRLFDSTFHICYATSETEHWGHAPIAHLEIDAVDKADWDFRLVDSESGFTFYVNDYWTAETDNMNGMAPHLKFILMQCAISGYSHTLHLHTGAISNGNECLLLPGQKGSGKTTLVSSMLARGYQYLSDEVALLERGSCAVRPFPVAMCVKQVGLDLLSPLYPELQTLPVYQREDQETVRYLPPPIAAGSEDIALPVRYLVFPRYRPDAETALHPIKPVDALKRLLHDCQSMPRPLTLEDVRDLVAWLGHARCFEMPHSDLNAANDCLASLLPLNDAPIVSETLKQSSSPG